MPDSEDEQNTTIDEEQLTALRLKRARRFLIGAFASDDFINIYGLHLTPVKGDSSYVDVFWVPDKEADDPEKKHLDTLDVSKFVSARDLLGELLRYFEGGREPKEEQDADVEGAPESRSFQ